MSSAPIKIQLHIGDYIRDTEDLSLLQHGVYMRLMMVYYSTGRPLPNNLEKLCRRVHASSPEERAAVEQILGDFFVLEGPVWMHKRIEAELEVWREKTKGAQAAADARWKKIKENNETDNANAMRTQCTSHASLIPYPVSRIAPSALVEPDGSTMGSSVDITFAKPKTTTPVTRVSTHQQSAKKLLEFLNLKTGRNFRAVPANLEPIIARLKEGFSEQDVRQVIAKKVREWSADETMHKYLRPLTLFRRSNFANYAGELVVPPEVKEAAKALEGDFRTDLLEAVDALAPATVTALMEAEADESF